MICPCHDYQMWYTLKRVRWIQDPVKMKPCYSLFCDEMRFNVHVRNYLIYGTANQGNECNHNKTNSNVFPNRWSGSNIKPGGRIFVND